MMQRWICSVVVLLGAVGFVLPVMSADVSIVVNKTTQRMTVTVDGQERYSWPVSTGMADYSTPTGAFTPSRMMKEHYSKEWDDAPMPYSIFFTDAGHAIHGSQAVGRLGSPASHGCVRLSPRNASTLFNLVLAEGISNTRIDITGVDPIGTGLGTVYSAGAGFDRLTSFNPLTTGIMVGGSAARLQPESRRQP